ncbi:MAG: ferritin-like domain-containing protein [Ilumatobacteraceae bacterium]
MNFYEANASLFGKEALDVADLELMYQLEMSGEQFYYRLADRVGDEQAADLLRKNGVEERAHARRLAKALSVKLGRAWEPTAEQQKIMDIPLPETLSPKLFAGIVQGELGGDAGYQRGADTAAAPEVQRLRRLNGREETIHAQRAQQVLDLIEARSA